MKTFYKALAALLIFSACNIDLHAQQYPCTVIDVMGSRYGDSMWLFTVEGTTDGYDNGWDGYKMFGSSLAPQIFAVGSDLNNYQVYTSSNIHGVNISFRKGEDSQYTLYFKHYDLSLGYQQLYLLDKKTMAVTDIYNDGTQYSFTSEVGDTEDRFVMLTYLETKDDTDNGTGDGTSPNDGTDTDDNSDGTVDEEDDEVSNPEKKNPKGKGHNKKPDHPKFKSFRVFAVDGNIVLDNPFNSKAKVVVVDARSGRTIRKDLIPAGKISTIRTNLKKGAYIVNVSAGKNHMGKTIVL
jgi:hypothetical protein